LASAAFMLKIDHLPQDYYPVLRMLELTFLAYRRVRSNLVLLQRLISGAINAPALLLQMNFKIPTLRSQVPFMFLDIDRIVPTMVETSRSII